MVKKQPFTINNGNARPLRYTPAPIKKEESDLPFSPLSEFRDISNRRKLASYCGDAYDCYVRPKKPEYEF